MTEDRVPTRFRVARPTTEPRPYRVVAIVRVRQSIHTDFAEGAAQGAGLCEGDQ